MKIEIDTHTHTIASGHAYNTMEEMAREAAARGLLGLAITDHAPDMPDGPYLYYFQNLRIVPRRRAGIELLLGSELNIRNEQGEVDLAEKDLKELDITVASIHTPCYKGGTEKENITRAYIHAMKNPYVDIIGHPDDARFPVDYEALVKAAKETGTLLELNNSSLKPTSFRENAWENMMEMLRFCKKYETQITLGTDSHVDMTIADYTCAEELLRKVDFPEELVANTSLEKLKATLKHSKKR